MPLKFSAPKDILDAPKAATISCTGINIRLGTATASGRVGEQTVTFYVAAFDAQDVLIHTEPIHVPLESLKTDKDFSAVYAALKRIAYAQAVKRFGAGTVS